MCGSMNPVSNAYCDKCNARIVPMATGGEEPDRSTSVRGLSLPTIPLDEQPAEVTPAEAAPIEVGPAEPAPAQVPQEIGQEEEGDWLAQLRDLTAEEESTAAGVLSDDTAEAEASGDWLTQLRGSAGPREEFEPAPAVEPVEPVEIPDWLHGLGPMGTGVAPSEPAAPVDATASTGGFPPTDWAEETAPPAPAAEPAGSSDWLQELAPPEAAAPFGGDVDETIPPAPAVGPIEESDWLQDLVSAETKVSGAPAFEEPALPEPAAPFGRGMDETTPAPEAGAVPDWLQDLAPAGAEAEVPGAPAFEEPALPEAAAPFGGGMEEAIPSAPAAGPAGMPDWLQDLAPAEAESEVPGAPAFEEPALPEAAAPFGGGMEETIPSAPAAGPAGIPDWLQDLAPAEAEPEVPGATAFEEPALPEAAAPFGGGMEETIPSAPAAGPAGIPDWLQELAPAEGEAEVPGAPAFEEPALPEAAAPFGGGMEEAIPSAPAAGPAGIPDWLQDLAPAEAEPEVPGAAAFEEPALPEAAAPFGGGMEETIPSAPAAGSTGMPDWLQQLAPTEAEAGIPGAPAFEEPALPEAAAPSGGGMDETTPAPEAGAVPDWLQQLAPIESAEEGAPGEALLETPALASADMPDWLQELAPAEAEPEAPGAPAFEEPALPEAAAPFGGGMEETIPSAPAAGPAGIPDWLQGMAPAEAGMDEGEAFPPAGPQLPEAARPAEPTPIAAEIPEWLRAAAPSSAPPPFVGAPVPSTEESPEWLAGLEQEAPQPPPSPAAFEGGMSLPGGEAAEAAGLARAQIPSWLEAMRPTAEAPVEAAVDEGPVETEGILEGLRGVLAPLPIGEEATAAESMLVTPVDEASLAKAKLLQSLLTRSTEAHRPQEQAQRSGFMEKAPRWLIAFALFMIVAGTLLPQRFEMGYTVPDLVQPQEIASAKVYNAIQDVSTGDHVVVAFEYRLSEADELNVVAESILLHLSERGAEITAVSSQPEGVGIAAKVQDDLAAAEHITLTYGSPEYIPGGATGIAGLLSREPKPQMIVVLAAQPAPLRWWIEQTSVVEEPPSVVAGISAMLEPMASPYLDDNAGQVKGAVIGLRDAAGYESIQDRAGSATLRLSSLALGQITIAVLMLAGAGLYFLSGPSRRTP
jgi:hypothetical protein